MANSEAWTLCIGYLTETWDPFPLHPSILVLPGARLGECSCSFQMALDSPHLSNTVYPCAILLLYLNHS